MRCAPAAGWQQSARVAPAQEAQQGAQGQVQGLRDRIAALERQLAAQQVRPPPPSPHARRHTHERGGMHSIKRRVCPPP